MGPIGAFVLGFGAAYATTQAGSLGDGARAVGDSAIKLSHKAKDMNKQHSITETTKAFAGNAYREAKKLNKDHKIVGHTKECIKFSVQSTGDFVKRHDIGTKVSTSVSNACRWFNRNMLSNDSTNNNASVPLV